MTVKLSCEPDRRLIKKSTTMALRSKLLSSELFLKKEKKKKDVWQVKEKWISFYIDIDMKTDRCYWTTLIFLNKYNGTRPTSAPRRPRPPFTHVILVNMDDGVISIHSRLIHLRVWKLVVQLNVAECDRLISQKKLIRKTSWKLMWIGTQQRQSVRKKTKTGF